VLDFYEISLTENKIEEIVEAAKGRGTMKQNLESAKILSHSGNLSKKQYSVAHEEYLIIFISLKSRL
jgi:hypothetical protein